MTKKGLTVEEVENIVNDAGEEITSPLYIGKRVGDDRDVLLDLDKLGSSLVTGGCGTGKTWFLMNVVANLIHFNEADEIDVRISSYGGAERYKDFRDSEKVTSFVGGDIRKFLTERSEERRVGKECRWVWAKEHEIEEERKKKE